MTKIDHLRELAGIFRARGDILNALRCELLARAIIAGRPVPIYTWPKVES